MCIANTCKVYTFYEVKNGPTLVDILPTPLYTLLGGLVWSVLNRATFRIAANFCEN